MIIERISMNRCEAEKKDSNDASHNHNEFYNAEGFQKIC